MKKLFNPNFPFSPKKTRVFYGWFILAASVLGVLSSIPGQTMGVSVFTDFLIRATNLSRLSLANAYLIGTLTSALLLPFGGTLIDAWGSRKTIVLSCACLGLSLVLMSANDYIANTIASRLVFLKSYIHFFVLVLGFASIRFWGQGMVTMTSRTMLAKWFQKKRGLVSGIQGVFVSFGFSVAPFLLGKLIAVNFSSIDGWRFAWIILAVFIGIGVNILCWIFFRDNPETCDLDMDGQSKEGLSDDELHKLHEEGLKGFTRKQALSTLAFWATTMAFVSQACIITAITFHIVSLGSEFGLGQAQAVWIFFPMAFVSTAVGYSIGVIADHAKLKYLFVFMMTGLIIGLLGFTRFDQSLYRIISIAGLGVSGGCFGSLSVVVLPRFFGRAYLGAIAGVQSMSMVAGSALGPSLFALLHRLTGSYILALQSSLFLPVLSIVLLLLMKQQRFSAR